MTFTDIKLFARLSGMTSEHITELFEAGAISLDQADDLIDSLAWEPVFADQPESEELSASIERLMRDMGEFVIRLDDPVALSEELGAGAED